ncbi:hydantoinase/oxoprolinase family protein [Streptomyces sp. ODS28]|uniref:hydantoinase/oxoprolinase family protein n=1 Tax=Streptomyces sp. ODS28 TaxID=3136688 RepID=UPI0031F1549C
MIRIGVDVGGTFTDVTALHTRTGRLAVFKLPSTAGDQSAGVAAGIEGVLAEAGGEPAQVSYLGHGTTVATNAMLERRGARSACVTTGGVPDVLEIARQRRPDLYDLFARKSPPLVPRSRTFEIAERVGADGAVLAEPSAEEIAELAGRLAAEGVGAVAVCLLHSYLSPEHERRVEEMLRERLPDAYVCRSSVVAPEFREYERFSTTVANAFIGPPVSGYVNRLVERVRAAGVPVGPKVIQSNGGLVSAEAVAERPVTTLLSGPSAGVIGAVRVAGLAGASDLITFDMGGTSTDVCLVRGGNALLTGERRVGDTPIRTPSLDIQTIGAGGGSIAAADPGGALAVGPRSAGSEPGPAAYGRGGTEPTVTDANVVRGRLNPREILGGRLAVDAPAARAALERVGTPLGLDLARTARGIGEVANAHMARAVRAVSVEAGEDPRRYTLVAFGGAGPLHAVEVADEVGITAVLVPPNPGTLCALGLLATDIRTDFVRSCLVPAAPGSLGRIGERLEQMLDEARGWLSREAPEDASPTLEIKADLRYARQNFELTVPLPGPGRSLDEAGLAQLLADFHVAHEKAYGFAHREAPVQLVNLRVSAISEIAPIELPTLARGGPEPEREATVEHRKVDFAATGPVRAPVLDRARLLAGNRIHGPAVIEQLDTTTVVPPGWTATVDTHGNLMIEAEAR